MTPVQTHVQQTVGVECLRPTLSSFVGSKPSTCSLMSDGISLMHPVTGGGMQLTSLA